MCAFYNGIDFHAHEILSSNPDAVRKLMDFGAESVGRNGRHARESSDSWHAGSA